MQVDKFRISTDHEPLKKEIQRDQNTSKIIRPIKCQCCPHIETSELIYTATQLACFYMRATLAFNGLITEVYSQLNHNFLRKWLMAESC